MPCTPKRDTKLMRIEGASTQTAASLRGWGGVARLGVFVLAAVLSSSACAKKTSAPDSPLSGAQDSSSTADPTAQPATEDTSSDTPTKVGRLDRSVISAVIKKDASQIEYCYQRVLVGDPTLEGGVVVKFTIAKDGSVPSAMIEEDNLGEARVTTCLIDHFKRMQFPSPENDGIVIVSYPFVFSTNTEE